MHSDIPTTPAPPVSPSQLVNPPNFHNFHGGLSLLGGWFPLTVEIVTAVLVIVAIGWRTKRWRLIWLPISMVLGVAGALVAKWYMDSQGLASDPAPVLLWVWCAILVGAIGVAVLGWTSARWWRRGLSVLVLPLSLLAVLLVVNQWVGYYPTWQSAWGAWTAGPLPHQVDASALPGLRNTNPATGKLVKVDIPNNASGFKHRSEYVFLPPVWFHGATPPKLPVLMMIGGEFNTAADWMRSGNIMPTIDDYVHGHGGASPIFVFVDSGGSFNNDTECVNGPRGKSADHLTKDVRPYVVSTYGASPDPADWGIVGWSMGGTCAVDLTVMHPELFHTFEDIAGDHGPVAGTKAQTIARLYGGSAAQWAAYDPATVMAKHGPYTGVSGWFEDTSTPAGAMNWMRGGHFHGPPQSSAPAGFGGHGDAADYLNPDEDSAAADLCKDATAVGIQCSVRTVSSFHTWQFASYAFADALPWMAAQVHAPNTAPAPAQN